MAEEIMPQEATEEVVEETPAAEAEEGVEEPAKAAKKEPKAASKFAHGAKHRETVAMVDKNKVYTPEEAFELLKKTSYTKFDGSVDVHVRISPSKKNEDVIRGTVVLPHGTGRERRVVIITDEMIEKIEKGWLDFDVAVATPDMMPKLAKLAKILGPKGLMPNPKAGTVTPDAEKAAQELKGGRVEYKTDTLSNIHQSIGKVSWAGTKLTENLQAFIAVLPKNRIKSITVAPTMGAGVKVSV
jgi:large subunit ribosomal protein L1